MNGLNDQTIINIVNFVLDELYEKEKYLFKNDLSERNMVFHFSRYFSNNLNLSSIRSVTSPVE